MQGKAQGGKQGRAQGREKSRVSKQGEDIRCGLVALLGPTNAGKSSLLNRLVESELALVSRKAQTTRFAIRGVLTEGKAQVVFLDPPGFLFRPRRLLETAMRQAAEDALSESDLAALVLDAARKPRPEDQTALSKLAQHKHAILILNKVDIAEKKRLLERAALYTEGKTEFKQVLMVSAKTGSGVDDLRQYLLGAMPVAPWLFDAETKSDLPPPLAWAEITRGAIYAQLHQDLPYAIAVETEAWEYEPSHKKGKADLLIIRQVLHVETESQKKIVVGKNGTRIGALRTTAEKALNQQLATPEGATPARVHLFVRVTPRWAEDPALLARIFPILPTSR